LNTDIFQYGLKNLWSTDEIATVTSLAPVFLHFNIHEVDCSLAKYKHAYIDFFDTNRN